MPMIPAPRALKVCRSLSVERASTTIMGNREAPSQWVMIPASVRVWSCAAAASRKTLLTAARVVPDDVTTLKIWSSGTLRSSWLLNRPTGSIGTSSSVLIASGSWSSAVRIRPYGPHSSRCRRVSSRSRSVRSGSLSP